MQKQILQIFEKKLTDALLTADNAALSEGRTIWKDIGPAPSCPHVGDLMRNIQHTLARGHVARDQAALQLIAETVTSYDKVLSSRFIEELMEVIIREFPRDKYVRFAENTQGVYTRHAQNQKDKFNEHAFKHELSLIHASSSNMANRTISRVRTFLEDALIKKTINSKEVSQMPDIKKVFVVHGRNDRLKNDFFAFLRALGLQPIEWSEALRLSGQATPYIGEVLKSAFENAQAVIVLLSPDDEVRLSPELWKNKEDENEKNIRLQARPNVLFEAGMAFGLYPERTLLIEVGQVKAFSDVAGRHVVRLSNSPDRRNDIAGRLRIAGCKVSTSGNDWLDTGNFEVIREQETTSIPNAHIPDEQEEVSHETLVLSKLIHPGLSASDHNNCVITGRLFNKSKKKVVINRVRAYDRNGKLLNITWSNQIDQYGNPEKTYELIGFVDSEDIFLRQDNGEEIEYCKLEIFHSFSHEPLISVFDEYEDWIDQSLASDK